MASMRGRVSEDKGALISVVHIGLVARMSFSWRRISRKCCELSC